jgi:hypothetical protein
MERKYNLKNVLTSKQIVFLKGPYCSGKKFLLNSVCEEYKFTCYDLDLLNFNEKHKLVFFPGLRFNESDILVIHHIEWFEKKDQIYILDKINNITSIPIVFINTDYFMLYYRFRKLKRFVEIKIPKPSYQSLKCMFPGIPNELLTTQNITVIKNELMMLPDTLSHQVKKRKVVQSKPSNIFEFYDNPTDEFAQLYQVGDMIVSNCTFKNPNDLMSMMQFRHHSSEITSAVYVRILKKYNNSRFTFPSMKLLRPVSETYYKRCKLMDDSLKTYKSMKPVMDHWFQIMHVNADIDYQVLNNTNPVTSNKARMILY